MVVALGSIGINGLACCLAIYGTHHSESRDPRPVRIALGSCSQVVERWPWKPRAAGAVSAKPMISFRAQCVPRSGRQRPAERGDMFKVYLPWHTRVAPVERPRAAAEFGAVLAAVCEKAKIPTQAQPLRR